MIDRAHPTLSVSRQCHLLEVSRAAVYRRPAPVSADDLRLMELINRQYLARPFYGSHRMAAWLATQGVAVNRKRVQRLMCLRVPEVGLKSRRHALQRNRGAPLDRGQAQQSGQSQCGQTGAPLLSGQRIVQNSVQASASSIRSTCFRLIVRAAAVRRKGWDMGDLRSENHPSLAKRSRRRRCMFVLCSDLPPAHICPLNPVGRSPAANPDLVASAT
jgi:hypothetical protein